jgi:hypothetical protein
LGSDSEARLQETDQLLVGLAHRAQAATGRQHRAGDPLAVAEPLGERRGVEQRAAEVRHAALALGFA